MTDLIRAAATVQLIMIDAALSIHHKKNAHLSQYEQVHPGMEELVLIEQKKTLEALFKVSGVQPQDDDPLFKLIFNTITHNATPSQVLFSQRRLIAQTILEAVRQFERNHKEAPESTT